MAGQLRSVVGEASAVVVGEELAAVVGEGVALVVPVVPVLAETGGTGRGGS